MDRAVERCEVELASAEAHAVKFRDQMDLAQLRARRDRYQHALPSYTVADAVVQRSTVGDEVLS